MLLQLVTKHDRATAGFGVKYAHYAGRETISAMRIFQMLQVNLHFTTKLSLETKACLVRNPRVPSSLLQ
jgi:hypothetical protein